ncbi:hypothetical protein CP985_14195 [Malaciobacter mytili LMG 24559]|uniref:Uncharacterized protein n=1 Tax=Malaciobacter mytili LMG 24559 TaxID=1032238 RepID=A0AAX2ACK6_9BACT|nr:hypothetical protein [Malaciobacter mytili]AXH16338.1 hypothetical protein AMYT_a0038 [Malaciobacter mytili LMG 24559]RXK12864.1 hypothetical protein CP985_14195 [Malaciobacter mytili LMG 24559]
MQISSLNCRKANKEEEKNILKALCTKVNEYFFNGKKFGSIYEVYKYCKKNKICNGTIKHKYGNWGTVKSLILMKEKEVIKYF